MNNKIRRGERQVTLLLWVWPGAARQWKRSRFRWVEQESRVFNQIKFSKLAVKTALRWFIPVYQVHEQGRRREQAAVASIRKEPLISTAPSVTKSNSHSPLIWFSSIILILPQPLGTQTTKKKKKKKKLRFVVSEKLNIIKMVRLSWFELCTVFSIKMYSR